MRYLKMVKKKIKKKHKDESDVNNLRESVGSFFTSMNVRFLCGMLLGLLSVYVCVAMISYFITGGIDQSVIENPSGNDRVSNWGGVWGAHLSETLINQGFGVSTFFMLYFVGSASAWIMGLLKMSLFKRFMLCSALMVWFSLFLSFCFSHLFADCFFLPGGAQGRYLSDALERIIGKPGTVLVLFATFIIIAVAMSSKVTPFLQKIFKFSWLPKSKKSNNPDEDKDDTPADSEDEDEDEYDADSDRQKDDGGTTFIVTEGKDDNGETVKPLPTDEVQPDVTSGDDDPDAAKLLERLGAYDPRLDLSSYRFPTIDLLKKYSQPENLIDMDEQTENKHLIEETLSNFGISIDYIKATVGPTLTLYEVKPSVGVRIAKIRNLEDDIALNLKALGIRIIAPMPGKGTIGIEVPNKDPQIVSMQSIIASRKFIESKYDLPVALGRTITNEIFMFDLCKMPHLLVAGATGQGKSVGLNAIITSLLYKKHPAELKFVLIDPKMVEFSIYEGLERHYLAKLPDEDRAIITDCTKVIHTLNSLCREMDERYELLTKAHERNIKDYNERFINRRLNPEKGHKYMPYIVVIIDEFGDLIMTAGKEIELPIARIAQKARAVGIHMIIATQRPSVNIITGIIKANFPARVAFRVTSQIDSRTILDSAGANQLVGRGDLLFSPGGDMTRVQCAFMDTPEVENVASFIGQQAGYPTAFSLPEYVPESDGGDKGGSVDLSKRDPLFDEVARMIVNQQQGSTSAIQRTFSIGYNRAGRLMDQIEAAGIVGPVDGSKPRQVLVFDEYTLEQKLRNIK